MKAVTKTRRDGSAQVMMGNVIMKEKPSRKRVKAHEAPFSIENLRMREIEAVIKHRHGNGIPDPAGTDDVESCNAYLRAVAMTPASQSVATWALVWAPWADPVTLDMMDRDGSGRDRMLPSDAVAKLLYVTLAERTALGLKTIGACDVSASDRRQAASERKRERDRNRQEQKRRVLGMVDRKSQQASTLEVTKPWLIEGVSRRTWFYRQKKSCTKLSHIEMISTGDTPVQSFGAPATLQRNEMGRRRVADLASGLGDDPPAELQEAAPHGSSDRAAELAA